MFIIQDLNKGKITPEEYFINAYVNEVYNSQHVRTATKWLIVILDAKYENAELHTVMGDFGAKYAKGKTTNDQGNHPVPRKKSTDIRKITLLLIMWWMKSQLIKHEE